MRAKKSDRQEQIRRVRSMNEALSLIKTVGDEIAADAQGAQKLLTNNHRLILGTSLSASKGRDEEIKISHTGKKNPTKVSTKSTKASKDDFQAKLEDFTHPRDEKIVKSNKILDNLHENAKHLDAIESMLRHDFSGIKSHKAALDSVRVLKRDVQNSINTALNALQASADKHIPLAVTKLGDKLTSYLLDNISENDYKSIHTASYVTQTAKKETQFCVYIEIEKLKSKQGFIFDSYYFILTGIVNASKGIVYYLNALPDFRVPGKYPLGKNITSGPSMENEVDALLSHNDVLTGASRKPMPKAIADNKKLIKIKGVTGRKVEKDALIIQLANNSPALISRVTREVMVILNTLMGVRNKNNILPRKITRGKITSLEFVLAYPVSQKSGKKVDISKLKDFQNVFDLDDKDVEAIKNALLHDTSSPISYKG